MTQDYSGFHRFRSSDAEEPYGSFEVFEAPDESGWMWWACYPGHMPDGDAFGPFASAYLAYCDALELKPEE